MIKLAIVHNIFLFTSCPAESHPLPCISLNFWWGLATQIIKAHPVGATTVSVGVSTFLELPWRPGGKVRVATVDRQPLVNRSEKALLLTTGCCLVDTL